MSSAGTWQLVRQYVLQPRVVWWVYLLTAIAVSLQMYLMPADRSFMGHLYTHYNNYAIFKQSFFNLLQGKDLYILYPDAYWDLYKYSPAFALFMGSIAYLPDWAGLILWNLLNAMVLYKAIRMLPIPEGRQTLMLWFVLVESITSMQSSQSNGLLAGLIMMAFAMMEKKQLVLATLMLVMATFIKVYGAVGFVLWLFYPQKPKFIVWAAVWVVFFALIPIIVTPPATLMMQYESWVQMMSADQAASYGFSVMGWLHSWFGLGNLKNLVTIAGVLLFFLPLIRVGRFKDVEGRMLFLAHLLLWVIIFNHKAESPTFIIAIAGVAIWHHITQTKNVVRNTLLLLAFIFTCLSPTELFPLYVRHNILVPYVIKVVPCIIIWLVIVAEALLPPKPSKVLVG